VVGIYVTVLPKSDHILTVKAKIDGSIVGFVLPYKTVLFYM